MSTNAGAKPISPTSILICNVVEVGFTFAYLLREHILLTAAAAAAVHGVRLLLLLPLYDHHNL